MRDIKFRAWMKKNWMAYDVFPVGDTLAEMDDTPAMLCMLSDVHLMQYTGLKDKDGVEIYEGDITNHGVVEWNDDLPGFMIDNCLVEWYDLKRCPLKRLGNIHENPELIN